MHTPTERPMLFNSEMILAILGGRKTQTRRVIPLEEPDIWERDVDPPDSPYDLYDFFRRTDGIKEIYRSRNRYGVPGDILWARETMLIDGYLDLYYAADHIAIEAEGPDNWIYRDPEYTGKVPSIYMPKWACRIKLEVESVEIERLTDISEQDAIDEGIIIIKDNYNPISTYAELWNSINEGKGFGWPVNPWVRKVTFKPLEILA